MQTGGEDPSEAQHAGRLGHAIEEGVKDVTKVTIEAVFLALRMKKDRLTVSMSTPQDALNNVKEALNMGAGDKVIRQLINAHGSSQRLARTNPKAVQGHQDTIIQAAKLENWQEKRGIGQTQEHKPEQKQEQNHSQNLGF